MTNQTVTGSRIRSRAARFACRKLCDAAGLMAFRVIAVGEFFAAIENAMGRRAHGPEHAYIVLGDPTDPATAAAPAAEVRDLHNGGN